MIKIILLVGVVCSVLIPNKADSQQKWNTINYKENLKDTLLANDHFVHNNYTFKDENGKWHSNLMDENGKPLIDTSLYLIGANCLVENGEPHLVKFAKCQFNNDTLSINLFDQRPAYSDNIAIVCADRYFSSKYMTNYTAKFPGQEYVWETKKQKLKLSTDKFRKGKWLYGHINFNIDEFFKSDNYPLTYSCVKIKGFFKCVIQ